MPKMSINEEIARAKDQYNQAWQNFEYAAPEFVGVAIKELAAAEERLNLLYQLAKRKGQIQYYMEYARERGTLA